MDNLQERFFCTIMRFKKMESFFSTRCEMQMNELAILTSITGSCCPEENTATNLNVPDIQEKLQITKPAVSYILNTLEKKEYITRGIDPRDRRKISITATPAGMEAAQRARQTYAALWDNLLERFGEENMQQLLRLLEDLGNTCVQDLGMPPQNPKDF